MKVLKFGRNPLPIMHVIPCEKHQDATKEQVSPCGECRVLYFEDFLSDEEALEKFRKTYDEKF